MEVQVGNGILYLKEIDPLLFEVFYISLSDYLFIGSFRYKDQAIVAFNQARRSIC